MALKDQLDILEGNVQALSHPIIPFVQRKKKLGFGSCSRVLWMPGIFELRTFLQSQNGWKYGISLDENVKTHPLIRPFKTLTEKVGISPLVTLSGHADCSFLGIVSDRGIQSTFTLKLT